MNWTYGFFAPVLLGIGYLLFISVINANRDKQFRLLANNFGLDFEKPPSPPRYIRNTKYTIRRMSGKIGSNDVVIEDTFIPFWSTFRFSESAQKIISPPPLFGSTGTLGMYVHTDVSVNGEHRAIYIANANFVAPLRAIRYFLNNLSATDKR